MKWPLKPNSTTRGGFLMPALCFRFRLLFDIEEDYLLTQQTMSCESNYVSKEMKIIIRSPLSSYVDNLVLKLCKSSVDIQLEEMDGANRTVLHTVYFSGCILKNHKVKYDYGASEPVKHILTFKADNIQVADELDEKDLYFEDVLVLQ